MGSEEGLSCFSNVEIVEEGKNYYLTAMYKGRGPVRERMLKLDVERYREGKIPQAHLLAKYFSFLTCG